MKESMAEGLRKMFDYIYGGGLFDGVEDALNINPSSEFGGAGGAWQLVTSIYDTTIVPIALGLMIIWFLVGFMQKATMEQMSFEQIFLLCAKLVVAFYLVKNGLQLFADLWGFGNAFIRELGSIEEGSGGLTEVQRDAMWKALTDCDKYEDTPKLGAILLAYGQLLFPWMIAGILSGCATFIAYSRILEMLLRVMLAPIALSDFMNDGLHGSGWRYLKSFLAICMQGGVIILITQLWSRVQATMTALIPSGEDVAFMDMTVGFLVISIAAIALMFKSLSVCRELVGA